MQETPASFVETWAAKCMQSRDQETFMCQAENDWTSAIFCDKERRIIVQESLEPPVHLSKDPMKTLPVG